MTTELLRQATVDGCRLITINRPDKANALTIGMLRSMAQAIDSAEQEKLRAVIITGAGTRGFCAGADFAELESSTRAEQHRALRALVESLMNSRLPIISLIYGKTLGAGCMFAVLSDVVIASQDVEIGLPEMKFGMYPALLHAILLEKLPFPIVKQLCLGARNLTGRQAMDLGLVTEVVEANDIGDGLQRRLAFYLDRLTAINVARLLDSVKFKGDLLERIDSVEKVLDDNLTDPGAMRLLEMWLGSHGRSGQTIRTSR